MKVKHTTSALCASKAPRPAAATLTGYMNFQHAVGSLWRIKSLNWLLLGRGLAAICLLNLPVNIGHQTSLSASDVLSGTVGFPLSDAVSIEPLPVQAMAWEVDLPGSTTIGNPNNNTDKDNAGKVNRVRSDQSTDALSPALDDKRAALTNDPRRDQQWSFLDNSDHPGATGLFAARARSAGNFPVVVAVVDSGLMLGHEDLEVLPGYDFISDSRVANDGDARDNDPSDPGDWVTEEEIEDATVSIDCSATRSKWHGTAVSGIIGAISDNQRGITGGAPSVLLLPVRVTGKCGGYIRDLVDGIRWAAGLEVAGAPSNDSPARVINLSVGFPGACPALVQNAIDSAVNAGAAVVVAATNSAAFLDANPQSPASCANVTTVGAVLRDGSLAPYSAVGSQLSLMAPGGSVNDGIMTTQNASATSPVQQSSYGFHFGTSMAAAHVTATFATLLSIDPSLTNAQLELLIRRSAIDSNNINGCPQDMCGTGRLNAKHSVDLLFDSSINQTALGLAANDAISMSSAVPSASTSATPAVAAATDEPDAILSAATNGIGQIDFSSIALLFGLSLAGTWRQRVSWLQILR